MVKTQIPKNLWITDASVGFLHEGLYAGAYGLELTFHGEENPGDTGVMSEILQPLSGLRMPRRKIARLTGKYNPKDTGILLLIRMLKSWGYHVQAVIGTSDLGLPWVKDADWVILRTEALWIPVVTNELWYSPSPREGDLPEPKIPRPDQTIPYLSKGYPMEQTTRFILESQYNWNLL